MTPRHLGLLASLLFLLLPSGCGGSSSGSSGSPTSPSGATGGALFPQGIWVGTISRPDGSTVAVRWEATRGPAPDAFTSGSFDGPATLTYGGKSVTARISGSLGGSNTAGDGQGYQFNFGVAMAVGTSTEFPACEIQSCCAGSTRGLHDNSTSITTSTVDITYTSCRGFIEAPFPPGCSSPSCAPNWVRETSRLVLNRQ